jgi:hypothetical protein
MSAEAVQALHAQAHALDAEADNAEVEAAHGERGINETQIEPRHPAILRLLAKEFHELAERMQGNDPATVNARAEANRQMADYATARDGIEVQKEETP